MRVTTNGVWQLAITCGRCASALVVDAQDVQYYPAGGTYHATCPVCAKVFTATGAQVATFPAALVAHAQANPIAPSS